MGELKLNNLVNLVLVVGSDRNSGLELHPNSKTHPRHHHKTTTTQENNSNNKDVHNNGTKESADGDVVDEDLIYKLTDPEASYQTQVLQIFSSSLASYPHRSADEQLVGYPHQLFIPSQCRAEDIAEEEENSSDILRPKLNGNRRNSEFASRRHMSLTPGMLTHQSLADTDRLYKSTIQHSNPAAGPRRASIGLSQLGRRSSISFKAINSNNVSMRKSHTNEMPLDFEQINAICNLSFPEGFRCHEQSCKPSIVSYVLTDLNGDRFYALALTFYRNMAVLPTYNTSHNNPRYILGDPDSITYSSKRAIKLFVPCCVVLVTSYPYYDTLQRCLTELYSAIQPNFADLDDQVKQLALVLTNVPVPPAGGDLSLTFQARKHGLRLAVHPATHPSRSVTDLNMSLLFSLLKPERVCTIISALLQEERLVFVSSSYALLTLAQETIMNMIYPFRWQSMYVPVLHAEMLGLVEAPGYFVMGCHSDYLSTIKMVEGLVIVDLNKGRVTLTNNDDWESSLPLQAAGNFCARMVDTQMNFDLSSAGKVIADPTKAKEEFYRHLNSDILEASLSMMADLFSDVYEHIIPDQKFFNKATYLSSQLNEDQQFYKNLVETTMFKAFLRDIFADESPYPWTAKALEKNNIKRASTRTSRSVQTPKKRSLIALQFENSCKTFNLPYMLTLEQFQDDSVLNLSAFSGLKGSAKSSRATALYIIGAIRLQRGELAKALNSFGELHAMDNMLFPAAEVVKALNNLDYPEDVVETLLPQHRSLYRGLLHDSQYRRKSYITDVKVDLESLPKVAVAETDFSKYAERLDLAVGRQSINRLYQALSLGTGVAIEAEHLKAFYECWKDNEASCRDMETTLSCKSSEFSDVTVLKVSSSLVRTDLGLGHVILTTSSLLLLKSGCKVEAVKRFSRISRITKLQVDSALVILKPVECLKVTVKDSVKPVNLFLEGESGTWQILLNELIGGKIISTDSRDSFLMQQAAQNMLLLDALISSSKLQTPRCLHSKDLNRAIDLLAYYSKEETKDELLISCDATKDILLYKLNPNADELDNGSVECIMYIPGTDHSSTSSSSSESLSPSVWCGMSNGKIRIFDAASWRLYPRYVQATDRVICLAHDSRRIWAGSFDTDIYVIANDPQALEYQVLSQHKDYVVDLQLHPQSTDVLISADIKGNLVLWNSAKLEVIREIKCPYDLLTSFRIISHEEVWCCCKDSLVKLTLGGEVVSTLFYIDETDRRMQLECFCIVGCDIWAGCSQTGRIVIWDKEYGSRRAILPLDTRGVSKIIAIGNSLYIGCKCVYNSRRSLAGYVMIGEEGEASHKCKLYIVNAQQYKITEELSAHTDSIRCMFAVSNQYVLTGSASKEGKIAIWKHRPELADSAL